MTIPDALALCEECGEAIVFDEWMCYGPGGRMFCSPECTERYALGELEDSD